MNDKKQQELFEKKLSLETDLRNLERLIYDLETKYLEETSNTGSCGVLLSCREHPEGVGGVLADKEPEVAEPPAAEGEDPLQREAVLAEQRHVAGSRGGGGDVQYNQLAEEQELKANGGGSNVINSSLRPKRTKRKKNYAIIGDPRQTNMEYV